MHVGTRARYIVCTVQPSSRRPFPIKPVEIQLTERRHVAVISLTEAETRSGVHPAEEARVIGRKGFTGRRLAGDPSVHTDHTSDHRYRDAPRAVHSDHGRHSGSPQAAHGILQK